MTTLLYCEQHGLLKADGVIKKGKNRSGSQDYRCKACYREMRQIQYQINKAKILEANNERRKANPAKYAKIKADSRRKHAHKHRETERIRQRELNRRARRELHDWYIKKLLTKRTELRNSDIPQGVVELKKTMIQMNRKIKKITEEVQHDKIRKIHQ